MSKPQPSLSKAALEHYNRVYRRYLEDSTELLSDYTKSGFTEFYKEYLCDFSAIRVKGIPINPCRQISLIHDELCVNVDFSTSKKESNSMNTNSSTGRAVNTSAILALAGATNSDEFANYDKLPSNIQEVLKKKAKEQADRKAEEAAETILMLVNEADFMIKQRVERIRSMRRECEALKNEIKDIEMCREYGMESQNFVPLARGLGLHIHVSNPEISRVPESFAKKFKPASTKK